MAVLWGEFVRAVRVPQEWRKAERAAEKLEEYEDRDNA
jgi:hypothetical protein